MSTRLRRSKPTAIVIAAVMAGLFVEYPAHSASCHGGGGGQTVTSLSSSQNYQLGISTAYRVVEGHFGPTGEYSSNQDSTSNEIVLFGGSYRLSDDVQVAATLPLVRNIHKYRGASRSNIGFGDPVLEGRYAFWDDVMFLPYRPGIDVSVGMRLPVGISIYDTTDPFGANVIGDGTPTFHASLAFSKRVSLFRLTVDGTLFFPFEKTVDRMRGQALAQPYRLKSGNRFQMQESLGVLLSRSWSISTGLKQLWQAHAYRDGLSVDGSASRLFSTALAVAFSPGDTWQIGASYETLAPFYRYAGNQPNFQTVAVTATYGAY